MSIYDEVQKTYKHRWDEFVENSNQDINKYVADQRQNLKLQSQALTRLWKYDETDDLEAMQKILNILKQRDLLHDFNFSGLHMPRINLAHANLEGSSFYLANLKNCDLTSANMSHTVVGYSNFYYAFLKGTNLRGADMRYASLGNADLTDANLTGADLTGAVLLATKLDNTQFYGANLSGAQVSYTLEHGFFNNDTIMPDGSKWHKHMRFDKYI